MTPLEVTLDRLREVAPLLKVSGGDNLLLQHFSASGVVGYVLIAAHYETFQQIKTTFKDDGLVVHSTSASNSGVVARRCRALGAGGWMCCLNGCRMTLLLLPHRASRLPRQVSIARGGVTAAATSAQSCRITTWSRRAASSATSWRETWLHMTTVGAAILADCADGFTSNIYGIPATVLPAPLGRHEENRGGGAKVNVILTFRHGNANAGVDAEVVYPNEARKILEEITCLIFSESRLLV
ncbi:hypothetical protein CUR178_00885 [Leishmania enriettii]|uniref:Uncharacterized protein n=1 Tax=Leishmania enriettii TaxID=5663 RepID=A0A836G864_LEIEN|nr:hypothetical protein CUR178_00885 [Leishmania enriettii]